MGDITTCPSSIFFRFSYGPESNKCFCQQSTTDTLKHLFVPTTLFTMIKRFYDAKDFFIYIFKAIFELKIKTVKVGARKQFLASIRTN